MDSRRDGRARVSPPSPQLEDFEREERETKEGAAIMR